MNEPIDSPVPRDRGARFRIYSRDAEGRIEADCPLSQLPDLLARTEVTTWVDILDPDSDIVEIDRLFREVFHFHPLAIDDALQETHQPKIDDWSDYLYIVFHALGFDESESEFTTHEMDVFLGRNYLVTYHNEPLSVFDSLRNLIERDGGQRLAQGPDHLLYNLLDLTVADYLPGIEALDDALDELQADVFHRPEPSTIQRVMAVKRTVNKLHRILIPQREILNRLARDEYAQIDPRDRVYFRDIYDHLIRLHEVTETQRDLVTGVLDTYLSALSNRTNDTMKTLTIVTVLFLPLNFLVGFFGMNFFGDNIHLDTLSFPHTALFVTMCVVLLLSPWGMYLWARHRGWF